eukprot:GILI01000539.1.p1 GENE.GILI01000539.1~~GILI01000539.1.p1  ORF type:complete len:358 (+),score=69.74 GILI01000539.1:67-1140(+)
MSYFILTNLAPPTAPGFDLWTPEMDDSITKKPNDDEHKVSAMGTPVILHTKMLKEITSIGPIPSILENFAYRIWFFPVERSTTTGRVQYGITTSYWGPSRWLFPVFTASIGSRLQFVTFPTGLPPLGNHPAKWEVTYDYSRDAYLVSNPFYGGKIMRALEVNDFELYPYPPTDDSYFKFYWHTCNGPIIPCTNMLSIPKFMIVSYKYKKALKQSLTAPYLSLVNINLTSVDQHFFFPPVNVPNFVQVNIPYSYNMHFLSSMDTMICFQDDMTLSTRTEAGPWEELAIESCYDQDYFGGFVIRSDNTSCTLTGHSDGTVTLKGNSQLISDDDYFVFLPIGMYTPYPIGQIQNTASSKI